MGPCPSIGHHGIEVVFSPPTSKSPLRCVNIRLPQNGNIPQRYVEDRPIPPASHRSWELFILLHTGQTFGALQASDMHTFWCR